MELCNLDMICKRWLLERNLPIQYYMEALFHGASALRELSKDTLQIVNTVNLPLNSYFSADLPSDFVDDVGVFIPVGNLLSPVPKIDALTPLRLHNNAGQFVPYASTENQNINNLNLIGGNQAWTFFWNVDDYGEFTGRSFGANGGDYYNGYKVVKERRQIQFTQTFTNTNIVLQYISNGQSADNATQIEWLAFQAIIAYIDWKRSPNAAIKDSYEAATFYNEKRLLRANLSSLTLTDLKNVLRSNYTAGIKN